MVLNWELEVTCRQAWLFRRLPETGNLPIREGVCWLLGTSVLKIDDFALDLLTFLGAVAFTDEGMLEHFVCLHPSCKVYAVHPLLQ
jgi:hypothetical protein